MPSLTTRPLQSNDWLHNNAGTIELQGCFFMQRLACAIFLLITSAATQAQTICQAASLAALQACISAAPTPGTISLSADLQCSGSDCCAADGKSALINLSGKNGITLEGNGHTLKRLANQRTCPAVSISAASGVTIADLTLDEDRFALPCGAEDVQAGTCAYTMAMSGASNVTLGNVFVEGAKGYAVVAEAVDGLTISKSTIADSGVIGVYVGQTFAPSRSVSITNSTISGSRTNGIAIQGLAGDASHQSVISGNEIYGNHWHGLWPTPTGTMNPGGQVDIVVADNLTVTGNRIGNGHCENCDSDAVGGIEMGNGTTALSSTVISNNFIYNNSGASVYANTGTPIGSTVALLTNTLVNNGSDTPITGATDSGNVRKPARQSIDWEAATSWPADWTAWQTCPGAAQAQRWCPGPGEAMSGQCVARMTSSQCSVDEQDWMQGSYLSIGENQHVYATAWVRNGGAPGLACLVFISATYVELGTSCKPIQPTATWAYHGIEPLEDYTPPATRYVAVRFGLLAPSAALDVDNIRVTW